MASNSMISRLSISYCENFTAHHMPAKNPPPPPLTPPAASVVGESTMEKGDGAWTGGSRMATRFHLVITSHHHWHSFFSSTVQRMPPRYAAARLADTTCAR